MSVREAGRPNERVNILVASEDAFEEVLERCARAGLRIERALPDIGVLTGTIASELVAALEAVPGVAVVERERPIDLPPAEDEIQ
jgi:hypothetical protein